jgi:hypothetical protein
VPLRYKFVELTRVTAATLDEAVNRWVAEGWQLDAIRFVVPDGARRPKMAFVQFVRDPDGEVEADELPARSSIRRRGPRVLDLGELDPGEIEPYDAELDWSQAKKAPATTRARRGRGR